MGKIKGIQITLYEQTDTGDTDPFGTPIVTETAVQVDNVLVYPASTTEILDTINLYGKKAVYTLAIPKGDTHEWENRKVSFFGEDWKTFGFSTIGIEENIPLSWNKKISVERYG